VVKINERTCRKSRLSRIGLEMAKQVAAKNYNLILVARSQDKLEALQKDKLIRKLYLIVIVCGFFS
jgi:NADP-dependent 3-hydroxy acid dehydrogenase YdfG